jgi:hypothetical protein
MGLLRKSGPLFLCTALLAPFGQCTDFSFSRAQAAQAADDAAARKVQDLVAPPCRQKVLKQKTMVLIAEETTDGFNARQERYGPHYQAINARLRALGLATFTQEEIRQQVAQAEIDAYFKNDPDAALAASKSIGANYILRGNISTQTGVNPILHINEVSVYLTLTLAAENGRVLSQAEAHADSYSGTDTVGMALTLVKSRADSLVAQIYNGYCTDAGLKSQ